MQQVKRITILFTLLLGLLNQPARATLVDDGNMVFDDVSGLQWLDLSVTDGSSYNGALAANSADGWRHATEAEFLAMFERYFPASVGSTLVAVHDSATINYANTIAGYFGLTYATTLADYSYGLFMGSDGSLKYGGLQIGFDLSYANLHRYKTTLLTPDSANSNVGVFMVREAPVPESMSLLLLAFGLVGLGFGHRKA